MSEISIFGYSLSTFVPSATAAGLIRTFLLVVVGLPAIFAISRSLRGYISKRYTAQQGMIVGKLIHYGGLIVISISVFHELGFKLGPLLGAAGIVGIAVGFASQTSVSNIISGLFLIAEKPFVVGDAITVGETTGQVLSIDFLSVKLRTFDNKFVRIPNETLIKSQVTNITHFPVRRLDLKVGVAYKEDIGKVREVLLDVAYNNPLALQEPESLVIFSGFGNSSIDLLFVVWVETADFLTLKNTLPEQIKVRFDKEGIEIPFPHLSLYTGSATAPFPVKVVK
jgi:small-conductance mechanosensitive channel